MNKNNLLQFIFSRENLDVILLESQLQGHPSSKKSFLAIGFQAKICSRGENIFVSDTAGITKKTAGNPWQALKEFRGEYPGWHVGYLGYDLKNYTEPLESTGRAVTDLPDMFFIKPQFLAEIKGGKFEWIYGDEESVLNAYSAQLGGGKPDHIRANVEPGISKAEYMDTVKEIQRLIKEGDVYELNFSYPMEGTFSGNPFQLYQQLARVNPVPFGAFLSVEGKQICCASPERFLRKKGNTLLSEPIKGTSARSDNPETDERNKKELLNEKNRAENLMIVDLVRHDMARIAKPGTVRVDRLFGLQSFGTVHQLISSISCEIKEHISVENCIKACFPMGSMTGAPKIEVMKQIDRLENYRRGMYSGAIGYVTPDGDFDFNVVIRTAIIDGENMIYPVGGAITSDSDPELEWQETLIKAESLFRAIHPQKK